MAETVFVFGAGFSSPAKIPIQNEIMKDVSKSLKRKISYKNVISIYHEGK